MESIISQEKASLLQSLIKESENVVLTCHVRPDGDAIGSTLGLYHLLHNLGKNPRGVVPDMMPKNLSFLPGYNDILVYSIQPEECKKYVDKADLIICCDFNGWKRLDNLSPLIKEATCKKVLIDHHQDPSVFSDIVFSFPEMSSTCELVFRIICAIDMESKIDSVTAECLLTGIITDTRNFTVNCSNPEIYEVLIRLLKKDVDKNKIVKEALNTRSLDSFKLENFALSNKLEIFPLHRAALVTLSAKEIDAFNYQRGDTEGLVNRPLEIQGIIYSIFMREDKDCIKVSSRSIKDFPVSEICARLFNGGGHRQAAGGEFYGSLEDCRILLLERMGEFDVYLPSDN